MFGLTGLPLYIGVGALVVIVALSGALWVQTNRVQAKQEQIKAMELLNKAWETKVTEKQQRIDSLMLAIKEQNALIEGMADNGVLAQQRQVEIDRLQAELAHAAAALRVISEKYDALRLQAVGLDVCQTYGMVLRSLAGGAP